MRAINLIPAEERRGAGGAAGRSGGAAHVLLGLLAVLVLLTTTYTLQHRSLGQKRTELARNEAEAARSEARASELQPYAQFAALRTKRVETVTSLAASRFDWSHALRELARVIPDNVWLSSLQGTIAPGVALKSGTGGAGALRPAVASPALEIVGCAIGQDAVARMTARMRLIDGVSRVSLQSSVKSDAGGGGGSSSGGDCRQGRANIPQFALVVFFDKAAGSVPTTSLPARRNVVVATGATGAAATLGATAEPGGTP